MSTKEKTLLVILAAVNFTLFMDFMVMLPLGPELMKLFRISPQQFGFAVSAYSIMAGITGFISAFFVDKFDRKKILFIIYVGFVFGTFCCAIAPNYEFLVAARLLAGFFGGMIGAQVLSIVADTFEYKRRATAMGILMTSLSLATVLGVPFGLWLATRFGWHSTFFSIGILGVLIAFLILFFVPPITRHLQDPDAQVDNPLQVLTNIVTNPNQMRALLFSGLLMLGHFSIIPYIAPALVSNGGFSEDNLFLIYLVGGTFTFFTAPLIGKIADRHGKYPVFAFFALFSIIPVWLVTNLWPMPIWLVLIGSALFFILINGRMIPTQAIVTSVTLPQQRGGFMGINASIQQLSCGIATNIAGAIIVQGEGGRIEHYNWVGWFSIALILVCIFLAGRVNPIDV